jgi:hypothetical protein
MLRTVLSELMVSYNLPRVYFLLIEGSQVTRNKESTFNFKFYNAGYRYVIRPVINLIAHINFDPAFELRELRFGSVQENVNVRVMVGKGGMKFFRAK